MSVEDSNSKAKNKKSMKDKNQTNIEVLKKEAKKLNYEESIEALDSILSDVQDENISLDKIQTNYIKGHILLKHCEELLEFVEQEITEINPRNLTFD